jgi:hypothetical protein
MAQDFDSFPIYDPIIKKNSEQMSDLWASFMGTFYQNLGSYLSSFGFFVPNLSQEQINSITFPRNGQMVYNTTINMPQIWQTASPVPRWFTFTTT